MQSKIKPSIIRPVDDVFVHSVLLAWRLRAEDKLKKFRDRSNATVDIYNAITASNMAVTLIEDFMPSDIRTEFVKVLIDIIDEVRYGKG